MKQVISKFFILIFVFVISAGIYYYTQLDEPEEQAQTMGEARLPVVTANVEGTESNLMYGYTQEMEAAYMRDTLTLLPSTHQLVLNIYRYNAGILSMGFEIRSIDGTRLIENTQIEEWMAEKDKIQTILNVNHMLDKNTEYLLILKIGTEDFGEIYYYTRIIETQEGHYKEEVQFVEKFHQATFDPDTADFIISYLEPKSSEDNTNFGRANIHSSFKHITWGEMEPERVTEPIISCKELIGDVGCYELKYIMRAKNDYDEYQYYNVTEDYRVKWTASTMYLLNYERTAEQEFAATTQNISGSRINAGIDSDLELDIMSGESRYYIAFIKERALWLMDIKGNDITEVFSFKEQEDTDRRNICDNHEIEIVSIDDEGNLKFFVYGYMNRGEHEGNVGVALYSYDPKENICNELLFIPFTRSNEILQESIGKLSYVKKEIMYIMIDDCIYSIDLKGNEYVQITSNLQDGMYGINETGDRIAWQLNGDESGGTKIKVMNLEDGSEYEIQVSGKYRIKVLGFVGNDFAYGIAQKNKITKDENGYVTFPMNKLRVLDGKGEVLKEYSKQGIYFTSAEISKNMINLKQVRYNENRTAFVAAEDYQIFGNEEQDEQEVALSTIATDRKKVELTINFVYKITTSDKLEVIRPKEVVFDNTNAMSIRELTNDESLYYVYSYGKVRGVYTKEADAIVRADATAGVVLDENSSYLWKRISKPTEYQISGVRVDAVQDESAQLAACLQGMLAYNGVSANVKSLLSKGKSSLDILNGQLENRGLNLSGCSLSQVLYYVCNDQPVLGMLGEKKYVLVVGYDFYNAVLLNPMTGETYKQGIEETEEMFAAAGNRFLAIR